MKNDTRFDDAQLRNELIKRKIKVRKFQREAIYKCLPGKPSDGFRIRNANGNIWDVIFFIALNGKGPVALRASDVYLGTNLPKRTVIRIIDNSKPLMLSIKPPTARTAA